MYRSQEERNDHLLHLLPAIKSKATYYVTRYASSVDFDDVIQGVVQGSALAFLQRAEADLTFLDQDDDAITHRCVLDGWNAVRSQVRQEKHQTDLEDAWTIRDLNADPEEAAIASDLAKRMQRTIARLKPDHQVVCYSLMSGSTRTAATEAIGTTKQAWPHYRRSLQDAFAYVTLS